MSTFSSLEQHQYDNNVHGLRSPERNVEQNQSSLEQNQYDYAYGLRSPERNVEQNETGENGTASKSVTACRAKRKLVSIIVGLVVIIAIVVIILTAVLIPNGDANNNDDDKTAVCSDISLGLGDILEFTCDMKPEGTVTAEFVEKQDYVGTSPSFVCEVSNEGNVTCILNKPVTCTTKGDIRVTFYDSYITGSQQVTHTEIITLTIVDHRQVARIKQYMSEEEDSTGTFSLQCSVIRTCYLYDLRFVAGNHNIGENKTCTTEYSENDGYKIECKTTVLGDVIYQYSNGERIYCKLHKDVTEVDSVELVIPLCEDFNSRNPECRNGSSLFDCDVDDDVRETSCQDKCSIIQQCFGARYYIISGLVDGECPGKCSLTWCRERENNEIDRSAKIPYQELLCSGR